MDDFSEILTHCPLFEGMEPSELQAVTECLNGRTVDTAKGGFILSEGSPACFLGIVLSGTVQVERDDFYGNRSVMASLQPGELFAEAFAFAGLDTMPVRVSAVTDSRVLLLDCRRILTPCSRACHFHSLLLKNLLQGMAQKNLALSGKIRYMSQKTTRKKLMAYLLDQAKRQGSREFVIPWDRQALADYLGVDRSAMSTEIGRLKKAGLLDTKGAWFCLKFPEDAAGKQ